MTTDEELTLHKKFVAYVKIKYNVNIHYIYFEDKHFGVEQHYSWHFNAANYYRLLIAELLPADLNVVLYLDSDLVIDGDLSEILNLEFDDDTYCYAVNHFDFPVEMLNSISKRLNITFTKYFNSGVIYFNLDLMRKNNVTRELISLSKKLNGTLELADQDVLNILFLNKWKELDAIYNSFLEFPIQKPIVIHYAGGSKPWHLSSVHPLKAIYKRYSKITPFQEKIPIDVLPFFISKISNLTLPIFPETLRLKIKKKLPKSFKSALKRFL